MKYLRNVKKYSKLDKIHNRHMDQTKHIQYGRKDKRIQRKWRDRTDKIDNDRLPNLVKEYKTKIRRNISRPRNKYKKLHVKLEQANCTYHQMKWRKRFLV